MKRASVCLVVLLFVVSLVSSAGSSAGRTLNATEAASLWGRGERCYDGDDNCEASDHCADQGWEAACELAEDQLGLQGPKFKCIYWPWNSTCTLATPVVCVTAVGCRWIEGEEEGSGECEVDPNSIPWNDKFTHQACVNGA